MATTLKSTKSKHPAEKNGSVFQFQSGYSLTQRGENNEERTLKNGGPRTQRTQVDNVGSGRADRRRP